jgi:archaellum component FlaC
MSDHAPITISRAALHEIYQSVVELESRVVAMDEYGQKIARRTQAIIRFVLFLLFFSMLVTFGLLYQFTGKMKEVVASMVDMYTRFDVMSNDMAAMTAAVTRMNDNISGIPTIAHSMEKLDLHVNDMRTHVHSMTANIVQMDDNMSHISTHVGHMANRFEHLTHTVHGMRYNVNQMSAPIRSTPWYAPFP